MTNTTSINPEVGRVLGIKLQARKNREGVWQQTQTVISYISAVSAEIVEITDLYIPTGSNQTQGINVPCASGIGPQVALPSPIQWEDPTETGKKAERLESPKKGDGLIRFVDTPEGRRAVSVATVDDADRAVTSLKPRFQAVVKAEMRPRRTQTRDDAGQDVWRDLPSKEGPALASDPAGRKTVRRFMSATGPVVVKKLAAFAPSLEATIGELV